MATLSVSTTLLYGVYVSEKSHLIGVRCLVKQEHSKMLAAKVAGHLPRELTDLIEKELYELEKASVRARWTPNTSEQNQLKFRYTSMASEAELAVCRILNGTGVTTTAVHNTKPQGGPERCPRYVHLSASRTQPSISLAIPLLTSQKTSPTPSFAAGLPYAGTHGDIRVTLEGSLLRKSDKATYTPAMKDSISPLRPRPPVGRILSVDGLDAAIRNWNTAALEAYVALLDLHVVADEGECAESALIPKFHIWQQIDDS